MRWNLFPEKQGTCWEMHRELRLICQKDNIYLKTSSKSNVGRTHHYIFKFFLKRASISDFCCNTNQNNPHILKYDSYDRSRLLQPCGKFFSWASPIPLRNFYPLAPPPLRNFHWPSVGGRGEGIFSGITQWAVGSRRPYREGTLSIRVETPGDITLQTSCHRFNNQGPSSKNGAPRPGISFVVFEEEILDSETEVSSSSCAE